MTKRARKRSPTHPPARANRGGAAPRDPDDSTRDRREPSAFRDAETAPGWGGSWRIVGCAAAVFLALAAWRAEVVPLPPYYETAMGLFHEANFLADTNFDYGRLRFQEKVGNDGGPGVYMTSVLPTLVAITMKMFSSPTVVFVVWHLLTFAAAAVIVTAMIWILAARTSLWYAAGMALAMITTPLAITQVEMIGMDVPLAACALLALVLLLQGRFAGAAVAATAAFLVKPTGMLVTLASIAFLASALLLHAPLAGSSRQRLGRGLAFHLAALGLQVGVYLAGGIHTRLRRMTFAESYLLNIYYTCPDLGLLFLLALLIGASLVLWHARQWRYAAGINAWLADARAALRGFVAARPEIVFSLIFVSATLLAIFVYTRVYVIRYLFVAVPFFYIVLSELLYAARFRRALWAAPVALTALNVVNADGRFFPAPPGNRRHCSVLERSREYLADHRSNIDAMRRLDDVAGDTPIVAGYPYSYFLSMPRLGYVRQPRRGYAIMPLSTGNFKPVAELLRDRPTRLIFTAAENPSHRLGPISPPEFTEGDQMLYRDQLNPPLLIFAKDLSPLAQSPEALDRWYAEHLWGGGPENLPPDLFAARARHLADMGRRDLAVAALEGRVRRVPSDLATNLELAQMLIQQGRSEEAIAASCAAIGQSVNQAAKNPIFALAHGHYLLGLALLQQRRLDDALSRFAETLRNAPQHVQAHFQAGVAWLAKGSPAEAEREFRAAVQLDPGHLAARYHLGYALEQSGRLSEAAEVYRGILQIDPKHLDARARLAALVVSGQS